jgi:DNA-binding SARP family transcriptional activator
MKSELAAAVRDTASFLQGRDNIDELLDGWLRVLPARPAHTIVLAQRGAPLHAALAGSKRRPASLSATPKEVGLLDKPFSLSRIEASIVGKITSDGRVPPSRTVLVVDMDWLLQAPSALANGALWGTLIARILQLGTMGCLSLYHRRHLPERDLLAGLHAHAAVLAADGCRINPYQLPPEASVNPNSAYSAQMRVDHWLARLSPTLRAEERASLLRGDNGEAPLSGGELHEMLRASPSDSDDPLDAARAAERWKVRCFGSMRVYRADGEPVQWHREDRPGKAGSTRKLRGLFAMLLLSAERGATAAELVEVLWPDATSPELALNRLHHTVNELRRCLLPPSSFGERVAPRKHPYLVRQDQRYFLRLSRNSWIDVEEFPQLCRQGGDLLRDGRTREALICFESALKLYTGDLFADLPASLTDGADADWCASTRAWLRELCLKVHGDCARIHRELGNLLQAASHCHTLLTQDPGSSFAHAELMRLHAMQGRREALERQFQLYRQTVLAAGQSKAAALPLMDLYVELMQELAPVKTPRSAKR